MPLLGNPHTTQAIRNMSTEVLATESSDKGEFLHSSPPLELHVFMHVL